MFRDGKLFGKVNIIDLFIVLLLIAVVAFGVRQFGGGGLPMMHTQETREFIIRFYAEEVENFTVEAIEIGDNVFDGGRNIALGQVVALDIADAIVWNADHYGNTVQSSKDGFSSLEISARLSATQGDHGIVIAGNHYGIGHTMVVRAGRSVIQMRVSGLEPYEP